MKNSQTFKELQKQGLKPKHIFKVTFLAERRTLLEQKNSSAGETEIFLDNFPSSVNALKNISKEIAVSLGHVSVFIIDIKRVGLKIG